MSPRRGHGRSSCAPLLGVSAGVPESHGVEVSHRWDTLANPVACLTGCLRRLALGICGQGTVAGKASEVLPGESGAGGDAGDDLGIVAPADEPGAPSAGFGPHGTEPSRRGRHQVGREPPQRERPAHSRRQQRPRRKSNMRMGTEATIVREFAPSARLLRQRVREPTPGVRSISVRRRGAISTALSTRHTATAFFSARSFFQVGAVQPARNQRLRREPARFPSSPGRRCRRTFPSSASAET